MATSKGLVKRLQIAPGLAKVSIQDETDNREEGFVLWNRVPTAVSDRIIHSMYVSLAREAIAHGRKLEIVHNDDSALIITMSLLGP